MPSQGRAKPLVDTSSCGLAGGSAVLPMNDFPPGRSVKEMSLPSPQGPVNFSMGVPVRSARFKKKMAFLGNGMRLKALGVHPQYFLEAQALPSSQTPQPPHHLS